MSIGIISHWRSGSGAILMESREETRLLREIVAELPAGTAVFSVAAPSGELKDVRTGKVQDGRKGLPDAYAWASAAPGRCLVVFDFHVLVNNPGHWRNLLEALPTLRAPKGSGKNDPASLVVFVGPVWDIEPRNPLRGNLPLLQFSPPDRDALGKVAESLRKMNDGERDSVIDSLCGLSADAAEQAAAEVIARGKGWDVPALRGARRQALKEAGLELREPISADDYGGMGQLKHDLMTRVVPWLRDDTLSVRRMLWAGVHGCLHAGTPIFDPVDGTTKTVEDRCNEGKAFNVIAIDEVTGKPVITNADAPRKYQPSQMARFTYQDGQTVTVTLAHRFWNGDSYVYASTILECLQKSGVYRLPSISDTYLSVSRQDGPRSTRTTEGLKCRCSSCSRLCDEQPRRVQGIGQSLSPSQGDAQERCLSLSHEGDPARKYTSNHQQASVLLSTPDCSRQPSARLASEVECRIQKESSERSGREYGLARQPRSRQASEPCKARQPSRESPQLFAGVLLGERHSSIVDAPKEFAESSSANDHQSQRFLSSSSLARKGEGTLPLSRSCVSPYAVQPRYDTQDNWIVQGELVGVEPYFDFHVPTYENYWAVGSFHHNTGKTLGAQLLAGMLNCECVVLSLSKLKAGIVGMSEANLSRAFRTISAMGKHSPLVVVIDEVDTIAKSGLDGGTSAGMWSILGEHLQYDKSCTIFIGTTNRYDLLDTALTQRFGRGYFFNLPGSMERKSICEIHYRRCGAKDPAKAATATSQLTEGYSARELAESIVPDVVAATGRETTPETDLIRSIIHQYTPTSVSQADQLAAVRNSASALRKANDCDDGEATAKGRRVANN